MMYCPITIYLFMDFSIIALKQSFVRFTFTSEDPCSEIAYMKNIASVQ